jgi:hypothetical protein
MFLRAGVSPAVFLVMSGGGRGNCRRDADATKSLPRRALEIYRTVISLNCNRHVGEVSERAGLALDVDDRAAGNTLCQTGRRGRIVQRISRIERGNCVDARNRNRYGEAGRVATQIRRPQVEVSVGHKIDAASGRIRPGNGRGKGYLRRRPHFSGTRHDACRCGFGGWGGPFSTASATR